MKITLLTYGTRGDVQPFAALALGLQDAGHSVRFAAPSNFEGFVRALGLSYAPLYGDTQQIMGSEEGRRLLESGDARAFVQQMMRMMGELAPQLQKTAMQACEGQELVISNPTTLMHGACISDKLGLGHVVGLPFPLFPASREFANIFTSPAGARWRILNGLTHRVYQRFSWKNVEPMVQQWRKELGLRPLKHPLQTELSRRRTPMLHAYSSLIAPSPSDWTEENFVSGFLTFREQDRKKLSPAPTAELERWLSNGEKPVFFGFGSMPSSNPSALVELVDRISERLKIRAVIGAGWSQFPEGLRSERVYILGAVDHEWLLPKCRAAVHHGGAGTTAASLRAGLPTLICAIFADQPYWGFRVRTLGVGDSIRYQELSFETLHARLQQLLTPEVTRRASEFGAKLVREDGVANAVGFLNSVAASRSALP